MKKRTIFIVVFVVIAILAANIGLTFYITDGFTVNRITNKVYNVQNVFDEISNLLILEKYGKETILTSSPTANKTYELGVFDFIFISECNAALTNRFGSDLWISIDIGEFFTEETTGRLREKYVVYEYDCRTKTLKISGTDNEDYLCEHFLSEYFKWQNSGKSKTEYSLENLGDYSIEIVDLGDYVLSSVVFE